MTAQTQLATEPKSDAVVEQKIQKLKELYADAPELGKAALENGLANIKQELSNSHNSREAKRRRRARVR